MHSVSNYLLRVLGFKKNSSLDVIFYLDPAHLVKSKETMIFTPWIISLNNSDQREYLLYLLYYVFMENKKLKILEANFSL